MKEIVFKDNILQKENRVKIPNPVVDSLNLKEGDPITIVLDIENEHIVIRKNKKKKK